MNQITYNGKVYTLLEDATPSSRVLTEYPDYLQFQSNSTEPYAMEYIAAAEDAEGMQYKVCWVFLISRNIPDGYEDDYGWVYGYDDPEDSYDWDDITRIIEQ